MAVDALCGIQHDSDCARGGSWEVGCSFVGCPIDRLGIIKLFQCTLQLHSGPHVCNLSHATANKNLFLSANFANQT